MTCAWRPACCCIQSTGIWLCLLASLGLGCGDDEGQAASKTAAPAAAATTDTVDTNAAKVTSVEYPNEVFVETEANRDPFRTFMHIFKAQITDTPQREVVMSTVGLDQMRVTAIISGVPSPRALIVDPTGVGYVVKRGDFVGRPEVLQIDSESPPLMLNWRVSRVRGADPRADQQGQVVLTRDNPMAPNQPPLTRVLLLGSEGPPK